MLNCARRGADNVQLVLLQQHLMRAGEGSGVPLQGPWGANLGVEHQEQCRAVSVSLMWCEGWAQGYSSSYHHLLCVFEAFLGITQCFALAKSSHCAAGNRRYQRSRVARLFQAEAASRGGQLRASAYPKAFQAPPWIVVFFRPFSRHPKKFLAEV